jgi:hypothetical protein
MSRWGNRYPFVRDRWYRSVSGEWLRVVALHLDDNSATVSGVSHLGCDFCYLNQAHTVAVCEFERSGGAE